MLVEFPAFCSHVSLKNIQKSSLSNNFVGDVCVFYAGSATVLDLFPLLGGRGE